MRVGGGERGGGPAAAAAPPLAAELAAELDMLNEAVKLAGDELSSMVISTRAAAKRVALKRELGDEEASIRGSSADAVVGGGGGGREATVMAVAQSKEHDRGI